MFPQVSMGALLQSNMSAKNKKYYSVRGTFSQKIIDYVVCDTRMNVVVIVELDDQTHSKEKDRKRDAMMSEAGYKTIRWDSRNKPDANEIAAKVSGLLKN